MTAPILVYNRRTRTVEPEAVFEGWFMRAAYGTRLGRLAARSVLRRGWFSALYGLLQRRGGSRRKIADFIARYGIAVDDLEYPVDHYRSFAEFFTRKMRPAARPVDRDPDALIAPADARLIQLPLTRDTILPVKGQPFTLAHLTGGGYDEHLFAGGCCLMYRLAPGDYHRFCYVEDGHHGPVTRVPGFLQSVSPWSVRAGMHVFQENRRDVVMLTTVGGPVLEVDVGALVVGHIAQHHRDSHRFARGEEKGYFGLGGSTIVLCYQPGRAELDSDIVEYSARGIETLVRYGERVGRMRQGA